VNCSDGVALFWAVVLLCLGVGCTVAHGWHTLTPRHGKGCQGPFLAVSVVHAYRSSTNNMVCRLTISLFGVVGKQFAHDARRFDHTCSMLIYSKLGARRAARSRCRRKMDVCAICHTGTLRRAFCLPCGHSYCHTCTARALWDKPSCPSCRAETKTAAPAWEQRGKEEQANATLISVRHRGVAFTVDLAANECPYERTSIMFSVPADRLKLICRGKQLARGSDPSELAGAVIQLIGSRQEQHLHGERRGALRRKFEETGAWMLDWTRPVWSTLRVPTWREVHQWPVAACRGLLLFFASLLPYSIAAMLLPESLLVAPRRTPEHQD
jgi:hypothetical protein